MLRLYIIVVCTGTTVCVFVSAVCVVLDLILMCVLVGFPTQ